MKQIINISSNGIKQAIDDLVNENEILQDKVYKLEEKIQQKENIIKEVREYIKQLKNFKIKYVMFEEKELYASENDFVKELLEILDKENKECIIN